MLTVLPAYGRQYKNATEAKAAWHKGVDFLESASRLACSRNEVAGDVIIRYGVNLEKVTNYTKADARKLDKAIAADRATRPVFDSFESWIDAVDKAVMAASGMSYMDLPDCDYYGYYDDGVTPKEAAKLAIDEAGF